MFHILIRNSLSPKDLIAILNNYQEDLKLVLHKHRYDNHILSTEEILSEINNYVVHYIDTLHSKNFRNTIDFKKFLYGLAKQFVKWTTEGGKERRVISYNRRKHNSFVYTDDGVQTMFEHICSTSGAEDDFHIRSNELHKYKHIYRWIFDYSHFFSDREKEILKMYWAGNTVEAIGKHFGVTHQAISNVARKSIIKIKHYIKIPKKDIQNHIIEGNKAINHLFRK